MRNRVPLALTLSALALCLGILAGCSDDSAPRSLLQVTSVNENQPLSSDVAEGPDSSLTVREDIIEITVKNNPHDDVLSLSGDGAFGYVTLERYEIRFESEESIPPVTGNLGWTVASGSSVKGSLVVVPASHKVAAPLISLRNGGEIQTTARLTITGREATSDAKVSVETSFPVHFANWTDED